MPSPSRNRRRVTYFSHQMHRHRQRDRSVIVSNIYVNKFIISLLNIIRLLGTKFGG